MDELKSAHLFRLADFYFIVIFSEIIVIFLEIIVVETLPFNTPSRSDFKSILISLAAA